MAMDTTAHERVARMLQSEARGRTVLTILYLVVLGLCFVIPVFYYFRMHCEDQQARRLRDLEMAGIEASLREQQQQTREETRAARRKYREEKRARLLQLFRPVRMVSGHVHGGVGGRIALFLGWGCQPNGLFSIPSFLVFRLRCLQSSTGPSVLFVYPHGTIAHRSTDGRLCLVFFFGRSLPLMGFPFGSSSTERPPFAL